MSEMAVKRPDLEPGKDRSEVIKILGQPQITQVFNPPQVASSISGAPGALSQTQVARKDEYSVSGLVQFKGDLYESDNSLYPVVFIFTGGLSELFFFPFVSADLAARTVTRHPLILWYDSRHKLIHYEREDNRMPKTGTAKVRGKS